MSENEYPSLAVWRSSYDPLKALAGELGLYIAQTLLQLARRYGDAVVVEWSGREHPGPPQGDGYRTLGVNGEAYDRISDIAKRSGLPRTAVVDVLVKEYGDDLVERLTAPVEVAS